MPLSAAELRQLARSRGLELEDGVAEQLLPLVEHLLTAAERLRQRGTECQGFEQPGDPEATR